MKQSDFWKKARKVLINKYAITLYVFAVLFVFIGDQSLLNQFSRAVEIRKVKKAIEQENAMATEAEAVLHSLENPDSLERFAREHYNMHADGEVVYVVE
jgi:cell division protein FtsB